MEVILTDCVHNSLHHFVYRNAVFMCQRLCAKFPSEVMITVLWHATENVILLWLYLQMDILSEAETVLCPPNEPSVEVQNGVAGYYLLGLIYRYTDQTKSAVDHFKQALAIDPPFWAAYEELCTLGVAEEARAVFGEAAAVCIQKQYLPDGRPLQNSHPSCDDQNLNVNKMLVSADDSSLRCADQSHKNGGATVHLTQYNTPSPVATQVFFLLHSAETCCQVHQLSVYLSHINSLRSTVNSTFQASPSEEVCE